ncbi:mRNA capping enzyme, alpha subunit [Cryphonectria parasitica EP155]|uniref:mRNA-capping enzyme subunit alpha n=1 Tax=Cryphonectria parasitica (strain ATCC 38755 / EP155) TaxID=660469 RepID=A0A9P4YCK2_CRYP1|nr:mRNA capping enzyme, alpha subunit [Cryphonectria parasitica EP155]KAF3770576.1 mRNA capping enzyme, alpha subunit [Cryphonectria parasitica EP155]
MAQNAKPIDRIDNPGIKAEGQLLMDLRREVSQLLQRAQPGFPGAQPVSFARRHLQDLLQKDYYVCEKTDGIRYLLYLTQDEHGSEAVYLIDRKNDFWFMQNRNLHFPTKESEGAYHTDTVIDGELVMDRQPDGTEKPSFLVFDCLVLDSKLLMERQLDKRLAYFQHNIYVPYKNLFKKYPHESKFQAFQLVMKDMQLAYGLGKIFHEVLPNLTHGNDGLIFTCRETPYKCGTDEHILKWKPADENTVDFKLHLEFPMVEPDEQDIAEGYREPYVDYESVPLAKLLIFAQGEVPANANPYREYGNLYITEDEWETLKSLGDPLIGRIVECYVDDGGRWRMSRFRDDKLHANHISVVEKVIESIQNPVTQQMLEDYGAAIRDKWKARARLGGDKA